MSHYSDNELLKRFNESENPGYAFDLIVRKYQEQVYWHIRRLVTCHEDANDIAQNVFLKAWIALPDFRGESGLFTWLYRIATNEALSFLKKKKTHFYFTIEGENQQTINSLESEAYFSGDEIEKKIQKAIFSLPEKQRVVFNLRYYDEMKYEDMSKILDTSEGALKASYHHAVKKIEKFLTS